MRIARNALASLLMAVCFLASLCLTAGTAQAADILKLKNGTTYEGRVTKEHEGYIWFSFKIGEIEQEKLFTPSEIDSLQRDVQAKAADAAATDAPKPAGASSSSKARTPGVTRAAVITLGDPIHGDRDMVGIFMTADALKRAIPLLEEELGSKDEGERVVVMRIRSGGGMLLEIQRLSDVIEYEYKPRFRVVAWIESAISAAAMTAHCIEDIYFTPQGNYGACTGFSGRLNAMKGRGLEEVLFMMEKISARGKKSPFIMRAMQISSSLSDCQALNISCPPTGALSATIDENGDVHWFSDETSGKFVLNPKGGVRILTFNADEALKFKFSKGTASNIDELGKLMGYQEIEWVGEKKPGFAWPICKAEQLQLDFREATKRDEDSIGLYWRNFQKYLAAAQSEQERSERGKYVGKAKEFFNKIKAAVKNNPNFKLTTLNMTDEEYQDWLKEIERLLREMMK
jgi:hypothetical protein